MAKMNLKEIFDLSFMTIKQYINDNFSKYNHTHKYAGSASEGGAANDSNKVNGVSVWIGTQTEYNNIETKNSTTLYFIKE